MKVLMINSVCGIRSTGRICTDIAELLEKQGHECKIAYGREIVPEKYRKYAVKIGNTLSVRLDALKTRIFDNAGFNSKLATKKFIKWVRKYDPDVIHLHNLHGYYLNIEILFQYLKTCKKRIIWTLHDCWAFTGHCAHFDFVGCKRWEKGCFQCFQKKRYPKSLLFNRAKLNYSRKKDLMSGVKDMTIITPSYWLAELVKKSFLQEYRIKVVPNGIDLNVFQPTKNSIREIYNLQDKLIILGVASAWDKYKGLQDFVELSQSIDECYQVVLVGLTKEQSRNLSKQILVIPRTDSVEELAQWYTAANVFLNLSMEETMGLTTVEAMACETPVIVYNKTALPEVVAFDSGIVVDAIVEDVIKALPESKKFSGERCRMQAKKFDKYVQYNKYLELYKENQ